MNFKRKSEIKVVMEQFEIELHDDLYGKYQNYFEGTLQEVLDACKNEMQIVARKIELIIEDLPYWNNSEIKITPIYSNKNECIISINDKYFKYINNNVYVDCELENDDFGELVEAMQKPIRPRLETFYIVTAVSNRNFYEQLKKDISLGFQVALPEYLTYYDDLVDNENYDIWRVKLDPQNLFKQDVGYKSLNKEPVLIRWLERNINGKQ